MTTEISENLSGRRDVGQLWQSWRQGRGERKRNNPLGYLFIAPAMILYLVFNIWPIVRGFLMAFTDYRFIYPDTRWDFNGVSNFSEMAADDKVWETFGVAIKYTLMVVPLTIGLALLIAVLISKVRRGAGFYRWVVYLPSILPVAVSFLMFREMYGDKFGFLNTNLRNWGVESPPNWLGEVATALPAIAVAHIWIIVGFPTLLFLIGIYNISSEVYEAAALDGANGAQQLRWITLPLLKPTLALIVVLLLGVLGTTDAMLLLTNGGPQDSTRTIGLHLYQIAFQLGDLRLGYAAAISLVLGLASALIAGGVFRWSRE
ncbi:MAG: sugar ABC transporter permease [Caldilineaceae bacterium]